MAGKNEFAKVISIMYNTRKQDGIFFVGSQTQGKLLRDLQNIVPDMFHSDCPVFLPREHSNSIELRLDNNIIFYQNREDGMYSLADIYAVNGGPPIVLPLGSWDHSNHVQLDMRKNRWDRRTDLMGAKFVRTMARCRDGKDAGDAKRCNDARAYLNYDSNGTVIVSGGTLQEKLFYMTENLNLTHETRWNPQRQSFKGVCKTGLPQKLTDVCCVRWPTEVKLLWKKHKVTPDHFSVIITERPTVYTLRAGVTTENTIDVWAFVEVFGLSQWLLYSSILILITIAIIIDQILLDDNSQRDSFSERFAMTFLFFLQQGEHTQRRHTSIRIMSLTLSMVTLVLFVYYANELTAKLTAGMPPHPVRNFEDVLDRGYKVIALGKPDQAMQLLGNSKEGTAKHTVYKLYFEKGDEQTKSYKNAINKGAVAEAEKIGLPWWQKGSVLDPYDQRQLDSHYKAEEIIKSDKNTLYYTSASSGVDGNSGTIDLRMDDSSKQYFGLLFHRDSEYLPVLRHYALKGFENGIFQRIDLMEMKHCVKLYEKVCWPIKTTWPAGLPRLPIKIGMTEPGPLGMSNVMFPFSFLGAGIIISLVIVVGEKVVKMASTPSKTKKKEVGFILGHIE